MGVGYRHGDSSKGACGGGGEPVVLREVKKEAASVL